MATDKRSHWPEGTYIEDDHYPNLWWCYVDNINLKGYDCLPLAAAFIESELKKRKENRP